MNREIVLGIALVLVILAVFGPKFLGSENKTSTMAVKKIEFENQSKQINAIKAEYRTEKIDVMNYRKSLKKRNAWNYGSVNEFVAETPTETVITVQAILGDDIEAFALINDNICTVGDMVADYKVLVIDPINQTVTLKKNKNKTKRTVSVAE
tara:strand:- start:679 stop:1134 length:456 start_codon:yes stop_codon:yes gene_type:complete